jgi:hypothetical protein
MDGASIYYTLNGDTPTADSTLYSGSSKPSVTTAVTIKAIAIKSGMENSEVLEAAYTNKVATPTASLPAGEVTTSTEISLSTATDGALIYYTTNGDTPTADRDL